MANAQEGVDRVNEFLAHEMSLEAFEDWSASYILDIRRVGDAEAQSFASLIRSIVNAFEDDEDDAGMRKELATAIRPFVQNRVSAEWSEVDDAFPIAADGAQLGTTERIPPQMELTWWHSGVTARGRRTSIPAA